MVILDLQFFGGRGASSNLSDGPSGGGSGGNKKYGQPDTPQMRPAPASIRQQIGAKGEPIPANKAMKSVNPYYNGEYADYSENCQRCVIALELNRRGYNVEAEATHPNDPYPIGGNWTKAFKGAQRESVAGKNTAEVNKHISDKLPDGGRAIVGITGHVFNVEKRNGKLYYYDGQVGLQYDPKRVFNNTNPQKVTITRVDNLAINDDVRNLVRKKTK